MNNEETKILNQSEETVVMNNATDKKEENIVENTAATDTKKKSVINDKAAYAAGGFAAGLASGVAGSAFAASPDKPVDIADEVAVAPESSEQASTESETATTQTVVSNPQTAATSEPTYATPDPEEVLLATDEGVRIAQVNDDASFSQAFADARAQVGAGGAFEWRGHVYSTYYEEEWNNMSAEERANYQSKIDYETVTGDTQEMKPTSATTTTEPTIAPNTELVDEQPNQGGIKVLGVEAITDAEGNPMTVAAVEIEGNQAILVDVDNNGMMDVVVVDENHDCQISRNEIYDVSEAQISTADLQQHMAATQDAGMMEAYNDGMPDYVNDADVSSMV